MGIVDDLAAAREAYERREWVAAYRALSDLDTDGLQADDFEALATTAYLLGRHNDCVQALQRAVYANEAAGNDAGAIRSAVRLALVLTLGGEPAVGGGWAARAERMLDHVADGAPEHGHVAVYQAMSCVFAGDLPAAMAHARAAAECALGHRDPDLLAHALNTKGRLMVHAGDVPAGLRLMDESLVGVIAGDVSPIVAGVVYCNTIEACSLVCDYGRMIEWTSALVAWCDSQPGLVAFTGQCAVHRGQLMRLRGAFRAAVSEFERAADRYALAGGGPAVGLAHEERGDVLRLLGDLRGAEQAYSDAVRHGSWSQPGQALLCSLRGDHDAAVGMIRPLLDQIDDPIRRTRILPAAVELLVAVGDLAEAARLADEAGTIAAAFGCPPVRAIHAHATGLVALARDEPSTAASQVRSAIAIWNDIGAAYEVARCRVVLGRALRRLGDERSALAELANARDLFVASEATPAADEARRLLGGTTPPGGLTPREVEVLRLVAAGRSNAEVAEELSVADKTVARHLSNIFTKLGVGSRTAAAAFAYEHGIA